jgi:hypothetical protein
MMNDILNMIKDILISFLSPSSINTLFTLSITLAVVFLISHLVQFKKLSILVFLEIVLLPTIVLAFYFLKSLNIFNIEIINLNFPIITIIYYLILFLYKRIVKI